MILALDIGTSSVRAALYDGSAKLIRGTMVKNERMLTATDEGGAEIDAETAFSQIIQAIDDVLQKTGNIEGEIRFVAVSSFWHSLVGIDKKGEPTTKVFGWAETRPAKYVSDLRKNLNESAIHNRTGTHFHSSYWTAKLFWLRKEFPEIFKKTAKWLSFSDYVGLKIFDNELLPVETVCREFEDGLHMMLFEPIYDKSKPACFTSVSMASGTGIFDIRACDWDEELLSFLKISREDLPQIVKKNDHTFSLNNKFKRRWKRLKNAEWFAAIGDGAANNIGAGCTTKEKAALMVGTSGAMRVAFAGEVPEKIPKGLWCYRIDRKRIIIGGALSDGGGLYRWLKDNFRLKLDDNKTEDEIAERIPDEHGLTFLPFLAGERSTGYNEMARGAILGLKSATDTIDIVQAALESVAYRFAEICDQLNEVAQIKEIIASGGALRSSPVWTQIIADVLAQNLSLPDVREASSRGAVLLALETIGEINSISELETPKGRKFEFNKKHHAIYQKARKRHEKFYDLLIQNNMH